MTHAIRPLAAVLLALALAGCSGIEQATEDPPGAGEHFASDASPAPAARP